MGVRLLVIGLLFSGGMLGYWSMFIRMPGKSYSGPLPPLTRTETDLQDALRREVETLAGEIGERNIFKYRQLENAANFLHDSLQSTGLPVRRQSYTMGNALVHNLESELPGALHPHEIVVIGAHYDSVIGSPGANDNASGTAGMLQIAGLLAKGKFARTLRFAAFVNEEPPFFQSEDMGSRVYARRCRKRGEQVVAMLSLETIGCYSDAKNSQWYPAPLGVFYPGTGNFIAFVGNLASRNLVRQSIASFRRHTRFPSEGGAVPGWIPGVGWSDHWSFWKEGYPAIMVTDTALYRYADYHTRGDTPEKVDYARMARVVAGLARVVQELAVPVTE